MKERSVRDATPTSRVMPLFDDLLALSIGEQEGLRTWAFALLEGSEAILVDAVSRSVQPALEQLAHEGITFRGLVLSHRHVVGTADMEPRRIAERWTMPMFLHPLDASHQQAAGRGPFEDPTNHRVLQKFSCRALLFPGHTAGHVLLHIERHGGVLLTGDCAMGVPPGAPKLAFVRPPVFFNVDDEQLRDGWRRLDLPLRSLLAYHGEPAIDRDDIADLISSLAHPEPTQGFNAVAR